MKIERCYEYIEVSELRALAGRQAEAGQYESALENLYRAESIALGLNYREALREISLERGEIASRLEAIASELEAEEREAHNELLRAIEERVTLGEIEESLGNYGAAIIIYERAEMDYRLLNETARATEMRFKIIALQQRMQEAGELEASAAYEELLRSIEALMFFGEIEESLGNYDTALMIYEEVELHYRTLNEPVLASEVRFRIVALQRRMQEAGDLEASLAHDEEIQRIGEAVLLGDQALAAGEFDRAEQLYNQAEAEFSELGEAARAVDVQRRLAQVESARRSESLRSIEIDVANGNLAAAAGEFDRAEQLYNQARLSYLELGELLRVAEIDQKLLELRALAGNREHEARLSIIAESVLQGDLAVAARDLVRARELYNQAVRDYMELGEAARALEVQAKITAIDDAERERLISEAERNVVEGDVAVVAGDFYLAGRLYGEALRVFEETGEELRAVEVRRKLAELEEAMANT